MFSSSNTSSEQVDEHNSISTEHQNSAESSSNCITSATEHGTVDTDKLTNCSSGADSTLAPAPQAAPPVTAVTSCVKREGELRTNFVIDASWSPIVRVVDMAGAMSNILAARVVRVVTEKDDEMAVECSPASGLLSSLSGLASNAEDSTGDTEASNQASERKGAPKRRMTDALNGVSKQPRLVHTSDAADSDNHNDTRPSASDVMDGIHNSTGQSVDSGASNTTVQNQKTRNKTLSTGGSKKRIKIIETAYVEPVTTSKPVAAPANEAVKASSSAQENTKKRAVEGSAFDHVYEMMKKKKQKQLVQNVSTALPAQQNQQQSLQKVEARPDAKNDMKLATKSENQPSPSASPSPSTPSGVVVGILSGSTSKGTKRRKQVRFRDENLVDLHTFEWIEDERINVSRPNFALVEGMFLRQHVNLDDGMDEEPSVSGAPNNSGNAMSATASSATLQQHEPNWYRTPVALELPPDLPHVVPGANSEERRTQMERERTVLAAIYFDKSSIPPSAAEPDREAFSAAMSRQPCTLIPLDDMTEQRESSAAASANGNGSTDADNQARVEERNNMAQMLAALGEQLASLQQIAEGPQLTRIREVSDEVRALQSRLEQAPPGAEAALLAEISRIVEPIRELCAQTTQAASASGAAPPSGPPPQRHRSWDAPHNSRWETEARNSPDMMPPSGAGRYSPEREYNRDRDRDRDRGKAPHGGRWAPPPRAYAPYSSRPYHGPPFGPPSRGYPPGNHYPPGPPRRPAYSGPPHHYGHGPPPIGGPGARYGPPRYGEYGEPYPPYGPPMGGGRRPAYAPYGSGYSSHGPS